MIFISLRKMEFLGHSHSGLSKLFQPIQLLVVHRIDAILIAVAQFPVKRAGSDGSRNFDPLCLEGVHIRFQCFDDLSSNAHALVLRQDEDVKQTAFILPAPVGTNGTAAHDCFSITEHIEMGPASSFYHFLRGKLCHILLDVLWRLVLAVCDSQCFGDQG